MCPLCGAEQRLGVWLPRFKARLFDIVKAAGDIGVSSTELKYDHSLLELAHGKARARGHINAVTVRNHMCQINDFLAGTDYVIRGEPGANQSRWRLVRRRQGGMNVTGVSARKPTLTKAHSVLDGAGRVQPARSHT